MQQSKLKSYIKSQSVSKHLMQDLFARYDCEKDFMNYTNADKEHKYCIHIMFLTDSGGKSTNPTNADEEHKNSVHMMYLHNWHF